MLIEDKDDCPKGCAWVKLNFSKHINFSTIGIDFRLKSQDEKKEEEKHQFDFLGLFGEDDEKEDND
jgi:hypothetical protein